MAYSLFSEIGRSKHVSPPARLSLFTHPEGTVGRFGVMKSHKLGLNYFIYSDNGHTCRDLPDPGMSNANDVPYISPSPITKKKQVTGGIRKSLGLSCSN